MYRLRKGLIFLFLLVSMSCYLFGGSCSAQCAMCKAVAQSSIDNGTDNVARGINKGILYLLAMPYLIGGIGVAVWYTHRKKNAANQPPD